MPRVLLLAILGALLLVPTTGASASKAHVRGTVSAKRQAAHLVKVKAARRLFALRVPGSLAGIQVGEKVELRGSTLRSDGRRSDVLASGVSVAGSQPLAPIQGPTASGSTSDDENGAQADDDNDEDNSGPSASADNEDDSSGPSASDDSNDHTGPGSGDDDGGSDD